MKRLKQLNHPGAVIFLLTVAVLFFSCAPEMASAPSAPETTTVDPSVYYVSSRGENSNSGSRERPFQTIQKAADVMVAGDTCFVRGGTYREMVKLKKSGTANSPIHFIAQPAGETTISGADKITSGWIGYFNYETWSSEEEATFSTGSGGVKYSELFVNDEKMTLADSLKNLTQEKTWFLDNRRIYLFAPKRETPEGMGEAFSNPDFLDVQGKVRDYAFNATGVNHIVIKGFKFIANESVKLDPGNTTVKVLE